MPGAVAYDVRVELGDGCVVVRRASQPQFTLPRVGRTQTARVQVRALSASGLLGQRAVRSAPQSKR